MRWLIGGLLVLAGYGCQRCPSPATLGVGASFSDAEHLTGTLVSNAVTTSRREPPLIHLQSTRRMMEKHNRTLGLPRKTHPAQTLRPLSLQKLNQSFLSTFSYLRPMTTPIQDYEFPMENAIIQSIKAFLVKENLPDSDALVAKVLFYPPNTIISVIASHEESAVLVPEIPKDPAKKLNHQLSDIFDAALMIVGAYHPEISSELEKQLRQVMNKFHQP